MDPPEHTRLRGLTARAFDRSTVDALEPTVRGVVNGYLAEVADQDGLGIEHSGITASNHEAGAQIWLRDPDHIWLEIYWANRNFFADRLRQRWREARRSGDRTAWVTGAPAPATTRIG